MDRSEELQTICNALGNFDENIVIGVDEVSVYYHRYNYIWISVILNTLY